MKFLIQVAGDLQKWAKDAEISVEKSISGALYDAAYQLYRQSKQALLAGSLGLPERVALTGIRQARKEIKASGASARLKSGARAKIPLRGLSPGVLYKVHKAEKRAEVGFVGQQAGAARIAQWAEEMAAAHWGGYTLLYDDELRGRLHQMGIHLKPTTRQAQVPARSIMDRARERLGAAALEKLTDSFERKMRGERT